MLRSSMMAGQRRCICWVIAQIAITLRSPLRPKSMPKALSRAPEMVSSAGPTSSWSQSSISAWRAASERRSKPSGAAYRSTGASSMRASMSAVVSQAPEP